MKDTLFDIEQMKEARDAMEGVMTNMRDQYIKELKE
jgi:hypothetical protein